MIISRRLLGSSQYLAIVAAAHRSGDAAHIAAAPFDPSQAAEVPTISYIIEVDATPEQEADRDRRILESSEPLLASGDGLHMAGHAA